MNPEEEEKFLSWFRAYQGNSEEKEQFMGIHLDVEPYLLGDWETNQHTIVAKYQEMIKRVQEVSEELNVAFGVDIPFWFDVIQFSNQYGQDNLAKWLIETVDEITIMAYRNYAKGEGGIIDISRNETKWANKVNKKVIQVTRDPFKKRLGLLFFSFCRKYMTLVITFYYFFH